MHMAQDLTNTHRIVFFLYCFIIVASAYRSISFTVLITVSYKTY